MAGGEKVHTLNQKEDEQVTVGELKDKYFSEELHTSRVRFIYVGKELAEE